MLVQLVQYDVENAQDHPPTPDEHRGRLGHFDIIIFITLKPTAFDSNFVLCAFRNLHSPPTLADGLQTEL